MNKKLLACIIICCVTCLLLGYVLGYGFSVFQVYQPQPYSFKEVLPP